LSEVEEEYGRQAQLGASFKDKDGLASGAIGAKSWAAAVQKANPSR
jgi:hypothetical protein